MNKLITLLYPNTLFCVHSIQTCFCLMGISCFLNESIHSHTTHKTYDYMEEYDSSPSHDTSNTLISSILSHISTYNTTNPYHPLSLPSLQLSSTSIYLILTLILNTSFITIKMILQIYPYSTLINQNISPTNYSFPIIIQSYLPTIYSNSRTPLSTSMLISFLIHIIIQPT